MIATAVLSTMLLLVTVIMTNIGNLFYKGTSQAQAQDDARSIVDDISSNLQLDGNRGQTLQSGFQNIYVNPVWLQEQSICLGNTRYTYVLYAKAGANNSASDPQVNHVLWRDTAQSGSWSSCPPANMASANPSGASGANGTDLIAPNVRLTQLTATQIGSSDSYSVSIEVAYGTPDLFSNWPTPTTYSGPPAGQAYIGSGSSVLCKGDIGDQYCGTSSLQTVVAQRLQ